MKTIKLLALLGIMATGCLPTFNAGVDPVPPPCGKQQPLQVVSLAYFPDPLPETRRIDQWRAVIRSDGTRTCKTNLQVVETDKPAGIQYTVHLASGINEILMKSVEEYRLAGSEVCFQVVAEIDGVTSPIPESQKACAKVIEKGVWSMR